jgi:hypothetical protein
MTFPGRLGSVGAFKGISPPLAAFPPFENSPAIHGWVKRWPFFPKSRRGRKKGHGLAQRSFVPAGLDWFIDA